MLFRSGAASGAMPTGDPGRQGMCTRGAHTPRPTPGWSPFILSPLPRGRQEPTCNKALLSSPTHPWGDPAAIRVGTRTSLCATLCNPMDYTVHGILQARILKWEPFTSPGDLLNPGIKPGISYVSCIGRGVPYHYATWEALDQRQNSSVWPPGCVLWPLPLWLPLGSPIFPSGCEGKLGVALESLQGRRDLT